MKKILLTAILGFLTATGYAQTPIKAGTVQLGGNVGYSQLSRDNSYLYYNGSNSVTTTQHTTDKSFSFNPTAGYFIADNLAIGLSFAQYISKSTYSYDTSYLSSSERRSNQLSLGAFVQYYHMFTDQFGLVGTLNAGYNHSTSRTTADTGGSSGRSNGASAILTPSIVFFPLPKFAVGASVGNIGYSYGTGEVNVDNTPLYNSTDKGSYFGASFGLSYLAFSGTYFIGR